MARINIEDSLFKDGRFSNLTLALGSRALAIGVLVEAWIVAQEFWKLNKNGIPKTEWRKRRLSDALVTHDLAEDHGDFIYMCGSNNHFEWLIKCQESGRKGGMNGTGSKKSRPMKTLDNSASGRKRTQADANLFLPSLPPTPSLNTKTKGGGEVQQQELLPGGQDADASAIRSPISYFIGSYANAYKERYGPKTRPDLRGKVQGQIKSLLKDVPVQRACELVQVYLQMDGERDWFKTKGHDFTTFLENLNPIGVALDTGRAGGAAGIKTTLEVVQEFEKREALEKELRNEPNGI